MTTELKALKKHFQDNCSIRVCDVIEESLYPHWKRLCFISLNGEELLELSEYIKNTFTTGNIYTKPRIGYYSSCICLTVDVADIKEHIIK